MPDIMTRRTRGFTRDTPTSAHRVIIARAELQDRRHISQLRSALAQLITRNGWTVREQPGLP
jgi:hypothetical protein